MQLSTIVEALITASEDPLSAGRIVELIQARAGELAAPDDGGADDPGIDPAEIERLQALDPAAVEEVIHELTEHYRRDGRAFQLLERAKGWKLYTRPEFAGFVDHLFPGRRAERLSAPAMETLAIVAYRQPITKAAIEAVRGVSCDAMLQKLLDRELVRIAGRAELPGRPLLYETTELFFEHFGIRSIDDLPNAHELRKARLPEPEAAEPPGDPPEKQLVLSAVGAGRTAAGGPAADPESAGPTPAPTATEPAEP